jgi:hypothetical protein
MKVNFLCGWRTHLLLAGEWELAIDDESRVINQEFDPPLLFSHVKKLRAGNWVVSESWSLDSRRDGPSLFVEPGLSRLRVKNSKTAKGNK